MIKKSLFSAILMLFFSSGFGAESLPQPDKVLTYKATPQGELKLHVFNPPKSHPDGKIPAIVFFHGGGWTSGGASQFYRQSRHLADRGIVAISADYRVKQPHKTTPQECVKDGKSAIRWLRAHAQEIGIDPNRLAAGGGSAGGHIAAATALVEGFDEEGEDLTVSCKPDALVLFNPVIDNGPGGFGYNTVSKYWEAFSPLHNIRADKPTPPAIFMLGTKDKLIPVATGKKFKAAMEAAGVRCDLILYEGQEHSFFNSACYEETIKAADAFLTSLGFLTPQ